jgi:hypothetical protein
MPVLAAREAMSRLSLRADLAPEPVATPPVTSEPVNTAGGTSIQLRLAQLEVDKQHHL